MAMMLVLLLSLTAFAEEDPCADIEKGIAEWEQCKSEHSGRDPKYCQMRAKLARPYLESCRAEQEKKRIQEQAGEQERNDALVRSGEDNAVRSDGKRMRDGMSAYVCVLKAKRAAVVRELATRKKYSALGGVDDVQERYDLQQSARRFDEAIAAWMAGMRRMKLSPASCNSARMKRLAACLDDEQDEQCPEDAALIRVINHERERLGAE